MNQEDIQKQVILRLNRKEREILLCGQLQAEVSISEIARQTGYKEHTVRYSFERFEEAGLIYRYPFINVFPLGYEVYGLFFSLVTGGKIRRRFLDELGAHPKVSWILELGGAYNFGVAIYAKRSSEITAFLQYLSESFGTAIIDKSVSIRTSWTLFPRSYLSTKSYSTKSLSCGDVGSSYHLDEIDSRLLSALSQLRSASFREVAQSLKLPLTTAQARLKRLKEGKVIVGFAYELNPKVIGAQGYRLLIYLKAMSSKFREAFYRHCEEEKHIFAIIECVGSWDFELKVEVEDDDELHVLIGKLYEKFPRDLREVKTLTVFDTPKLSFYPFETHSR